MCDYEWFNSYVEAILSDYVNRIVDLGSRTADLSPDVVLCNLVTDELGDGVRTYGVCDPESYLDMHLGNIAI